MPVSSLLSQRALHRSSAAATSSSLLPKRRYTVIGATPASSTMRATGTVAMPSCSKRRIASSTMRSCGFAGAMGPLLLARPQDEVPLVPGELAGGRLVEAPKLSAQRPDLSWQRWSRLRHLWGAHVPVVPGRAAVAADVPAWPVLDGPGTLEEPGGNEGDQEHRDQSGDPDPRSMADGGCGDHPAGPPPASWSTRPRGVPRQPLSRDDGLYHAQYGTSRPFMQVAFSSRQ